MISLISLLIHFHKSIFAITRLDIIQTIAE